MTNIKALAVVYEALVAIGRDTTSSGRINIINDDILDVTLKELKFNSTDRIDLTLNIVKNTGINYITSETMWEWNNVSDIVDYLKNL